MEVDITSAALKALGEVAPEVDLKALDPDKAFREQFDFDSVDFLNFITGLQEALNVRIPETDYPRCSSLRGCRQYILERLRGRTGRQDVTGEVS